MARLMFSRRRSDTIGIMDKQTPATDFACPACGGTEFIEGFTLSHAPVRFMAGSWRMLKTLFSKGEQITTMKCKSCGYLMSFANAP
jgi:transcription elongation factor Elf1